jgi:hypothetical protein
LNYHFDQSKLGKAKLAAELMIEQEKFELLKMVQDLNNSKGLLLDGNS